MLNEAPKKKPKKHVDYAHPNRWQLFWRVQKECWRRMVTPYLMYFFMSLLLLACQAIDADADTPLEIALGVLCIVGGAFYNGHLCYHYGVMHYDAYCAGVLHRKNEAAGIPSGGDHHVEREYRPWKGFYIGFLIGVPVLICTVIAAATGSHAFGGYAYYAYAMFAGWAIIPIRWIANAGYTVSIWFSLLFILLPVVVSGVMYIVGAKVNAVRREKQAEHDRMVAEAGASARERHIQTEEQRRKTLQSKKKKR